MYTFHHINTHTHIHAGNATVKRHQGRQKRFAAASSSREFSHITVSTTRWRYCFIWDQTWRANNGYVRMLISSSWCACYLECIYAHQGSHLCLYQSLCLYEPTCTMVCMSMWCIHMHGPTHRTHQYITRLKNVFVRTHIVYMSSSTIRRARDLLLWYHRLSARIQLKKAFRNLVQKPVSQQAGDFMRKFAAQYLGMISQIDHMLSRRPFRVGTFIEGKTQMQSVLQKLCVCRSCAFAEVARLQKLRVYKLAFASLV